MAMRSENPWQLLPRMAPYLLPEDELLQRNLVYTAINRGRKLVVIVGAKKAVAMAVKRVDSRRRVPAKDQRGHRRQSICSNAM